MKLLAKLKVLVSYCSEFFRESWFEFNMKVFIICIVTLAFIASSLAATTAAEVQEEFSQLINVTIPTKMEFVKNELVKRILESITPYDEGFVAARQIVVDKLSQMGSSVVLIVKKYDNIIAAAVNGMSKAFAEEVLKTEYNYLLKSFFSPLIASVTIQNRQINATLSTFPAGSKCWNEYKAKFEQKYNLFVENFLINTQAFTKFDIEVDLQMEPFIHLISKYEAAVWPECNGQYDAKCFAEYVSFYTKI
jgi:hypothetical protein